MFRPRALLGIASGIVFFSWPTLLLGKIIMSESIKGLLNSLKVALSLFVHGHLTPLANLVSSIVAR